VAVEASWAGDGMEGGGQRNTEDTSGAEVGGGLATWLRVNAAPWLSLAWARLGVRMAADRRATAAWRAVVAAQSLSNTVRSEEAEATIGHSGKGVVLWYGTGMFLG
jgi:hypothetical protein